MTPRCHRPLIPSATFFTRDACTYALLGLVALLINVALPATALAFEPPKMQDAVTDTAGKLSATDDRALERRITAYRNRTGNEIAVLLTRSLEGKTIEDVAYETFNTWGIGKKGLDNGVLLVIAPNERKIRIETGKGVGDRLTDIHCAMILDERVGPLLRIERYRDAIEAAIEAIEALLDGKAMPALPASLVEMPLVPGAFIVDLTGQLEPSTLEALEAEAAKEGRHWLEFAILVVSKQQWQAYIDRDDALFSEAKANIVKSRQSMTSDHHDDYMRVFLSADDREVLLSPTTPEQLRQIPQLKPRLDAVARNAPTLEEAIRAVMGEMVAHAKALDAGRRAASLARAIEERKNDRDFKTALWAGLALSIHFLMMLKRVKPPRHRRSRRRHRGSSNVSRSYGSSSSSHGSSSRSYGSSSYGSSSSSTSYSGGGGRSGGGGASSSY